MSYRDEISKVDAMIDRDLAKLQSEFEQKVLQLRDSGNASANILQRKYSRPLRNRYRINGGLFGQKITILGNPLDAF